MQRQHLNTRRRIADRARVSEANRPQSPADVRRDRDRRNRRDGTRNTVQAIAANGCNGADQRAPYGTLPRGVHGRYQRTPRRYPRISGRIRRHRSRRLCSSVGCRRRRRMDRRRQLACDRRKTSISQKPRSHSTISIPMPRTAREQLLTTTQPLERSLANATNCRRDFMDERRNPRARTYFCLCYMILGVIA